MDDLFDDQNDSKRNNTEPTFHIPLTAAGRKFLNEFTYAITVQKEGEDRDGISFQEDIGFDNTQQQQILSALFGSYELLEILARKFFRTAETIVFPTCVYELREYYRDLIPVRTMQEGDSTTNWFAKARKRQLIHNKVWNSFWSDQARDIVQYFPEKSTNETFVEALYQIFKASAESHCDQQNLFAEFFKLNRGLSSSDINAHCLRIESSLRTRIKGQPQAIRALIASEMKSFRRSSKKLRDIFTFAGPSGVGKTELARAYAEALCEATDLGYSFRVFNMEAYADERAAQAIFGAGSQYTDAGLGELTRHGAIFPRTIYLFDEIEKAHPTVIQSLLTLLDMGEANDQTTQESISFSQSIVIFTTNLGQREFKDSRAMGELNIFDLLEHAKTHNSNKPALTPEFVNRLRAGTAVRFFPLHAEALYSIAKANIDQQNQAETSSFRFQHGANMAALALFSNMPNPVPRAIANTLDGIVTRSQSQLFKELADQPAALDAIKTIQLDTDKNLFSFLDERSLIAYVGEDETVSKQFNDVLNSAQFSHVTAKKAKDDSIGLASFALICVDGRAFDQDGLADFIRSLRKIDTQVGVIVLSPSDEQLRDEYIVDYSWLQLTLDALKLELPNIVNLAKVSASLAYAAQKHLALTYDIEIAKISTDTARFIATDLKFTPQISAQRADDGVPGLVTRRPSTRLTDVIGLHRAKQQMTRIISWLEDPSQLKRYNLPMPTGVLLLGPPGTGKTLLARAVAGEVDLPFISLNIGEMLSSLVNGTATNLQRAFDAARDIAPCVMFIDEIDAIAGKRSQNEQSADRSHNAAVNTLLTQLDGLHKNAEPIFVIAATNLAESLDPALTRSGRLDHPILCDIPNSDDRRQFIYFYMKKYSLSFSESEIDQFVVQTQGMSGADMEQVFINTLYNVASSVAEHGAAREVSADAVLDAITYMRFGAPIQHVNANEKGKRQTAAHEAGHLLVQKVLLPQQRITIATIEARNRSLGFISTQREENSGPQTVDEIKAQLAVFMAGREAEQMLYGEAGMNGGAASDLQQATQLALNAICGLGLDAEFGLVNYGRNFFDIASSDERSLASERLRFWLEEAREKARQVLNEHHEKLEFITNELFERESVYQPEIEAWF